MTAPKLKTLDLFSGIGGFSLGLERTGGFETVAFCEIEPFPRKVLAKHWPKVPIYDDVRTLTLGRLRADGIAVDVLCGGFPCQDISVAGKGAGLAGERSGLWREYARLIGEIRPAWAIIENVSVLRSRGLDEMLRSLAALGYDAEWHCIPAYAVGAPHRRDRLWIVAYATRGRDERQGVVSRQQVQPFGGHASGMGADVADASGVDGAVVSLGEPSCPGDFWLVEPNVGRVAHGVPARVDRLRALGNAVVPQIPELIGRAILAANAIERRLGVAA